MTTTPSCSCSACLSGCKPLLGFTNLKEHIHIRDNEVECPVLGCDKKVKRQRRVFKKEDDFKCPDHHIWISPSTFEYPSEACNILNHKPSELELLERIKKDKRESRIARDNSEDALTWNVFRFLQNSKLMGAWLQGVNKLESSTDFEVIYWSVSEKTGHQYDLLNRARTEFGEKIKHGSEPDVIVVSDTCLYFIEAKLTATNLTPSSMKDVKRIMMRPNQYVTGGNEWFNSVFTTEYETLIINQRYELMRFWLLGTWMASEMGKAFALVNLVCDQAEVVYFGQHIQKTDARNYYHTTWEDVFNVVDRRGVTGTEKTAFLDYMRNKTIGYDSNGDLRKAFHIIPSSC